jgi:hypothetical protein
MSEARVDNDIDSNADCKNSQHEDDDEVRRSNDQVHFMEKCVSVLNRDDCEQNDIAFTCTRGCFY